jgi:GNAT superfamily N-acetyltransferase
MSQKPKSSDAVAAARAAIRDEYTRLSSGRVAAVITHLEMYACPLLPAAPEDSPYRLKYVSNPDLDWYRGLYRAVGENWLWFSRLMLEDSALARLIRDPAVQVYSLQHAGRDAGILELDARHFPEVEISFLGLVEDLIGKGAGRFLMNRALEICWARSPRRVTVHTCTLDHPNALGFYLRSGFRPYARSIEIADDPRLHGLLPRSAAPHIPIVE